MKMNPCRMLAVSAGFSAICTFTVAHAAPRAAAKPAPAAAPSPSQAPPPPAASPASSPAAAPGIQASAGASAGSDDGGAAAATLPVDTSAKGLFLTLGAHVYFDSGTI